VNVSAAAKKLLDHPVVRKHLHEKSTPGLLIALILFFAAVISFIGRILALDKTVALWISKAVVIDPATKAPTLKPWAFSLFFFELLIVAALAVMLIKSIVRYYSPSDEQVGLYARSEIRLNTRKRKLGIP
jgi:hypothetical protein